MSKPGTLNYLIDSYIHAGSLQGLAGRFVLDTVERRVYGDETLFELYGLIGADKGVSLDEFLDRIHPDDVENTAVNRVGAVNQKKGYEVEYRVLPLSRRYRWVLVRATPDKHSNGLYYLGVVFDIDERKRAEDAAHQQKQLMRIITDNATVALFAVDASGCCTFMNPVAEQITGYTFAEITKQPLHYMIHYKRADGEFLPMDDCIISRATREGFELRDHEDVFWRKDGSCFPIRCAVTPVFNTGELVSSIMEVHDLSQQKKLEAQTQRSIRHLELLNNIGSTITADLDMQAILQKVTDVTTKLSGAEFGAFFYNTFNKAGEAYMLYTLSGAPREAFEHLGMPRKTSVFSATFNGTGVVRAHDITQDARYGKNAPINGMPAGHLPVRSYLAVPVVSHTGAVIGGLLFGHSEPGVFTADSESLVVGVAAQAAIAMDNAQLYEQVKEAKNTKESQLAAAEDLNQKKDQFISIASHELKTPLTAIMAYVQLMERSVANKQYDNLSSYIEKTTRGLYKFRDLINDLLDVSRIEANKLEFNRGQTDLNQIVESCVESCRIFINTHQVIVNQSPGKMLVYANKERIEQVLLNFITNAVKYSPGQKEILINTRCTPREAVVTVTDFGMGIPKDKAECIFDKFYRVEEHSVNISGLGIGLFISKEIIERHGGYVSVESTVGKGSAFSFSLPLLQQQAANV